MIIYLLNIKRFIYTFAHLKRRLFNEYYFLN